MAKKAYLLHVSTVFKSDSLNLLELSESVRAGTGIALPVLTNSGAMLTVMIQSEN
jgi:hypothetical protein